MAEYEPVLLANIDRPESHTLAAYEATGGYQAWRRVVSECAPEDVQELVKSSALRGRGGAGFPTGLKWSFLAKDRPGPIYFCLNADESEPGTFNNRILMELDPHQVLEGLLISCFATRASTAYFYLRYEYPLAYRRVQAAVDECYAAGYLGPHILGSDYALDVFLHRGAGAYICGEETGLIESLEGKRAWPRIKPPFPAVEGAFRQPTVVNNVETVACVKHICDRGSDWFRSLGVPPDPSNPRDPGSFGPKLYCLSGHVERPGCYEAPLGLTVRELIEQYGGGVWRRPAGQSCHSRGHQHGTAAERRVPLPIGLRRPAQVRLPGAGNRRGGRDGRDGIDGGFPAQ